MAPWILAFLGIFLGCFARVLLPYIRKARADPSIKFDWKYVVNLVVALAISGISAAIVMANYTVPVAASPAVFFAAFAAGWAATDIMNEITATAPASPTPGG